jgi:hypothetical protein
MLFALAGCGVGSSIDREPQIVEGIRVDSVRILPFGSRFVLRDSATRILFRKFHPGYLCSEILELDLAAAGGGNPPVFLPKSSVRLPASGDCAVDSSGRDSIIVHVFGTGLDTVRLANSAGKPTDRAEVVRGVMSFDSLQGNFSPGHPTFMRGHLTVVDSTGGVARSLYADSLSSCQHLNQADFTPNGDSLKVRLSLVTVDAAASADTCRGPVHSETIPILKAAP